MFIGFLPALVAVIGAAVSIGAQFLIGALSKPKQADPEGRLPGTAIGKSIPRGYNDFVLTDSKWVEPVSDQRAFVPGREDRLFLTAIGVLATARNGAALLRLWIAGKEEVNFQAQEDAIALGENPNDPDTLRVMSRSQEFVEEEVSFNQGLPGQLPFPDWIAEYGIDDLIAYRNIITLGFYSLAVHTRGLSFPSIKAVLRTNTTFTVGGVIEDQCLEAGIDAADIDVSECTDSFIGFTIDRNGNSYMQGMQDLLVGHFIGAVELPQGILSFRKLKRPSVKLNIPLEALGARTEGDRLDSLISREIDETRELPRVIIFSFIEKGGGYDTGTVESDPHPRATGTHIEQISTQEVMLATTAKIIANKLLYQIWDRYIRYKFTLPFEYKPLILPLDVVTINNQFTVQIINVTLKANWLLEVEAYQYQPENLDFDETNIATVTTNQPTSGNSFIEVIDPDADAIASGEAWLLDAPLAFTDNTEIGLYAFSNFAGNLLLSTDGGINFPTSLTFTSGATYGTCDTTLGSGGLDNTNLTSGSLPLTDSMNSLTVTLTSGAIASLSDTQFNNQEVLLFVGRQVADVWEGEWICARNAVTNGSQVELFEFKRGLRGTEYYIDRHVAGEMIFLVDSNTNRISLTTNQINQQLFYKYQATDSQDSATLPNKAITFQGQGLFSYPPTDLTFSQDMGGDITFSFQARSRLGNVQFGEQNVHEIDVLNAAATSVVRTLTGNLTYTSSQQATDGLTAPFQFNVYRLNALTGRGYPGLFRNVTSGGTIPFVSLTNSLYSGIKTITASTYPLVSGDRNLLIKFDTTSGDITLTLGTQTAGFYVTIINIGSNNLILSSTNTIASPLTTLTQFQSLILLEEGNDNWVGR